MYVLGMDYDKPPPHPPFPPLEDAWPIAWQPRQHEHSPLHPPGPSAFDVRAIYNIMFAFRQRADTNRHGCWGQAKKGKSNAKKKKSFGELIQQTTPATLSSTLLLSSPPVKYDPAQ